MDVEAYHVIAQNATADKVTFLPFSQVMDHLNFTKVGLHLLEGWF